MNVSRRENSISEDIKFRNYHNNSKKREIALRDVFIGFLNYIKYRHYNISKLL